MVAPQNVRSVTLFKGCMRSELPAWNVKCPQAGGGVGIEFARIEPDYVQGSGCFIHPIFSILYY